MLTNQEKLAHYKKLSEQSKQLHAAGNLKERNKLCEPIRQLYREIDWGFKVGEKVLLYSGNRKVPVKILAHLDDNHFFVIGCSQSMHKLVTKYRFMSTSFGIANNQ